jgi:predicted O-methyltransferase YrrM
MARKGSRVSGVDTYQVPWELDRLLALFGTVIAPTRVLEIGSYEGGTLWYWMQQADVVVSVDDQMRKRDDWQVWADATGVELHTIQGDSQHSAIVDAASEHGPYDMIFIDGDHTPVAVRNDYMNYRPMLADGGCIVFHDIIPRHGYGVSEVWEGVKAEEGVRWIEIGQRDVEPGNEGPCGIGIAWL